jgi:hypothetical protein
MSPENDEELCRKYPMFYVQRNLGMERTCMCWGFDCGNGWLGIIDEVSAKIEKVNQGLPEGQRIEATQVKEKFGGLRIYASGYTEETGRLIAEAENKSFNTCEACGNPGSLRDEGWLYTRCDACFEKMKKPDEGKEEDGER